MGFWGTIREITKNSSKLKSYEQEQRDRKAKREELYKSREFSPEELQHAKELGKTIIDVIDVMDNHSESIAENVEEMCEPIVSIAPTVAFFGTPFLSLKYITEPNNNRVREIEQKFLQTEEAKTLYKEINEALKAKPDNKFSFREEFLFNKKDIAHIDDITLRKRAESLYKKYMKEAGKYKKIARWGTPALVLGSTIAAFVGSILYATKLQVDSSKIARFQAREFLNDPKAFVNYTPEQIEQAKAELEAESNVKKKKNRKQDKKLKNGFIRGTFSLFKDRRAYKQYKAQDKDETKLVTRELTPQEIAQAQRDKEIIQNTVRYINNQAEINSENMEVAAQVIIGATPWLGTAIGGAVAWLFNKTGFIDKRINKILDTQTSEQTKQLREVYNNAAKDKNIKGVFGTVDKLKKWWDFHTSAQNDLTQEVIENGVKKFKPATASQKFKRGVTTALAHKGIRNWGIALVGTFVTSIAGSLIGMKLQKSAARAGRYTAKRELEKDPRNFIGFSEEEYKQVEEIKSNEKKPSTFKQYATFLPRVLKEYWDYQKYRRGEYKETQKLREQLQKQEVTEEQLIDAQNLQRKLFNTFEKVDDNSQIYSESTEAAIQIAQPVVTLGGYALLATPFVIGITMLVKGKRDAGWALRKVTGLLGSSSWLMKSKPVKAYLNSVAKNLSNTMATTTAPACKPLGAALKNTDIVNDPIIELLPKIFKNSKNAIQNLSQMPKEQMDDCLREIERSLYKDDSGAVKLIKEWFEKSLKNVKVEGLDVAQNSLSKQDIATIVWDLRHTPHEIRVDMLNILTNPSKIKDMPIEKYNQAMEKLSSIMPKSIKPNNMQKLLKDFDLKPLRGLVNEMQSMPDDIVNLMGGKGNLEIIEEFLEKHIDNSSSIIEDLLKDGKTMKAFGRIAENMSTLLKKFKQQPGLVKENSMMSKFLNKEIELPKIVLKFGKDLAEGVDDSEKTARLVRKWYNKFQNPTEVMAQAQRSGNAKTTVGQMVKGIPSIKDGIPVPEQVDSLLQNIVKNIDNEANTKKAVEEFINALESPEFLEYFVGKEAKYIKTNPKDYKFPVPRYLADAVKNLKNGIDNPKDLRKAVTEIAGLIKDKKNIVVDKNDKVLTSVEELTGGLRQSLQRLKKYNARDIKDVISIDPKGALESLETKLKNMNETEFAEFMSKFGDFSQQDTFKIIANFKKILNNVPEKELKNIMKKAIEEFQKDPDKFIKMLSSKEKMTELFMTPGLQSALVAAGVSWTVISIGISYAINSWLAEMELKAGRLGVMKSLESLSDDRYYADVIAKN